MEDAVLRQMREEWDARARSNAEYFIHVGSERWEKREFFRSGEINVVNDIMPDMPRICGGNRSPLDLTMLEIGCGVGRMTRMLARIFGHVTAVDVSEEMIKRAAENILDLPNVSLIQGNGSGLASLESETHDFAFSWVVFQHIPSIEVISSYCHEVYRVLRPGSLFKFQVLGAEWNRDAADTWNGVSVSEPVARGMCQESGFSWELSDGAGSQYYWLWFRKPR